MTTDLRLALAHAADVLDTLKDFSAVAEHDPADIEATLATLRAVLDPSVSDIERARAVASLIDDPDVAMYAAVNLKDRFDWAARIWTRSDVEEIYEYELTDEEWEAISLSRAWTDSLWNDSPSEIAFGDAAGCGWPEWDEDRVAA